MTKTEKAGNERFDYAAETVSRLGRRRALQVVITGAGLAGAVVAFTTLAS